MRCRDAQKHLVECAAGDLGADLELDVRRHAASCALCGCELEELEGTLALLKDDGYREPSPFYWTAFQARLRARLEHGRTFPAVSRWSSAIPRLVPVAVAAACFVLGMWAGLAPHGRPPARGALGVSGQAGVELTQAPVISARSKLLVETGATQDDALQEFAGYRPDTLPARGLDPLAQAPHVVLATSELAAGGERVPGEQMLGE